MKPCVRNRKPIAWLALGELDAPRAKALRAHLETCEACRRYWEEVTALTESLAAPPAGPEVEATAWFHRRLVQRLRAEPSASLRDTWVAWLNWRVALPALGAAVVVVAILSLPPRQPAGPPPVPTASGPTLPPGMTALPPTVANYQQVALQSLDELDNLLTRQAGRPLPPAPLYTASSFSLD